ncbi:MAG: zinc ribbon domain-containing protein [Promethearchaeota archaeon]
MADSQNIEQNLKNINQNFIKFGKLYFSIGILYILQILFSLGQYFRPLLGLVNSLIGFIIFILIIMALSKIKKINIVLKDPDLKNFHSKMIASIIISFIGSNISLIINLKDPFALANLINYRRGYLPSLPPGTMVHLAINLLGTLLLWISYILVYVAYKSLERYFEENTGAFPNNIAIDAKTGAKDLKLGGLMDILGFLIITLLIGFIFNLIGYFKLGSSLKKLEGAPINQDIFKGAYKIISYSQEVHITTVGENKTSSNYMKPRFCRNCGAPLKEGAKFCSKCGAPVNPK